MKNLLEDLYKLIINETDLYRKLLEVLHEENQIIINSAVEKLHVNNKKKEVLILQIKLLDESCTRVFERIYQQLPETQVPASLREVIESVKEEPSAGLLRSVYSKLISLAQTVKEINSTNDRLIKGSLRAIKSSIAFLVSCSSTSGGPCYENSGQLQASPLIAPMIKKEA